MLEKDELREKFSNMLENKRIQMGLSYKDMSRFLEVSYLKLHRWVTKQTTPRREAIESCCDKCSVDYKTFMSESGDHSLSTLTLDNVCQAYSCSSSTEYSNKSFLLACSLLYNELQVTYGFQDLHLMLFSADDEEVRELKILPISCSITSQSLGQFILLPCVGKINFKHTNPKHVTFCTGVSENNFDLEPLTSNSIGRVVELVNMKGNMNIQ